mgnify:CR=1 FL=1
MRTISLIATVAGTADVTSAAFDLGNIQTFSVAVDFSGTDLVGTLTLQCSNLAAGPFTTVASSSQAVTASADHTWNVTGAGYRFVRVFWDFTSGTGNISATLVTKDSIVTGV